MAYHILNDTRTTKVMVMHKKTATGHDYKVKYGCNQIEMEGEALKVYFESMSLLWKYQD